MITYNHENYIEQAIDSILVQECNFTFEIVIGEDFSTDNTRKILLDYQMQYPNKINLILHPKNIGAIKNQIETHKACKGKYIAICEGDDYWTDPKKLQKQVDLMEANPNYSICFTNGIKISEKERLKESIISNGYHPKEFNTEYLISKDCMIPTASILFKNISLEIDLNNFPIGDYPLIYAISRYGKMAYIDEEMICYRIHEKSVLRQSSLIEIKLQQLKCIDELIKFDKTFVSRLKFNKSVHLDELSAIYFLKGNLIKSIYYFIKSIYNFPLRSYKEWKDTLWRIRKYEN